MSRFNIRDVGELVIGACVLAFPVAVTEEVWNLSKEVSFVQAGLFALASCLFLGFFIYVVHVYQEKEIGVPDQLKRVVATYGITLLVCAVILALLGKLPLSTDTAVAIKRVILVAFPASFSATVVDSLR